MIGLLDYRLVRHVISPLPLRTDIAAPRENSRS